MKLTGIRIIGINSGYRTIGKQSLTERGLDTVASIDEQPYGYFVHYASGLVEQVNKASVIGFYEPAPEPAVKPVRKAKKA